MSKFKKLILAVLALLLALCIAIGLTFAFTSKIQGEVNTIESTQTQIKEAQATASSIGELNPEARASTQGSTGVNASTIRSYFEKGGTVSLKLTEDVSITYALVVVSNANVTLDLAGHLLNYSGTYTQPVLEVQSGGTLTITDSDVSRKNYYVYENNRFRFTGSVDTTNWINGGVICGGKGYMTSSGATLGGGIYVNSGTLIMEGGAIAGNQTVSGKATDYGGGVYINGGSFQMKGGLIAGNYTSGQGGGVAVKKLTVFSMTGNSPMIAYNYAGVNGGGVVIESYNNSYMQTGSIINNTANSGGGIFLSNDGVFNITGGKVDNNTATSSGGGIYEYNGTMEISGASISGNTASAHGGGIYLSTGKNVLNNVTMNGNKCVQNGGAVFTGEGTYFNATSVNFTNNVATNSTSSFGGAIYYNTASSISNCTFTGNKAAGGAALYTAVSDAKISVSGTTIKSNTAYVQGGAIYQAEGTITLSGINAIESNITNNTSGYGVYFATNVGNFNVGGKITIKDNYAGGTISSDGSVTGGTPRNLYIGNSKKFIINETLTTGADIRVTPQSYSARSISLTSQYSGKNSQDPSTFINLDDENYYVTLKSNEVWVAGYSVASVTRGRAPIGYATMDLAVTNFNSNTDDNTVLKLLKSIEVSSTATLSSTGVLNLNGKLLTNSASSGNVITVSSGTLTIKDEATTSTTNNFNVTNNLYVFGSGNGSITGGVIAGGKAGGIVVNNGATAVLESGTIAGNNSSNAGGGVTVNSGATFTMTGGQIVGNTGTAGGVYVNGTFNLSGGTISYNRGSGGGVYVNNGSFYLSGGQIVNNVSNTNGSIGGVHLASGANLYVSGNPVVRDNYRNGTISLSGSVVSASGSSQYNIYLPDGKTINVNGTLTSGAVITLCPQTYTENAVITTNYNANKGTATVPSLYFKLDNSSYSVSANASGEVIITTQFATITDGNEVTGYGSFASAVTAFNANTNDDKVLQLVKDNSVSALQIITASGTIDLNGYVLSNSGTSNALIQVNSGSTITIKDTRQTATDNAHKYSVTNNLYVFGSGSNSIAGGIITGGKAGGIYVNGGTVNFESGTISGNSSSTLQYGGGVTVASGNFNFNGGSIVGNYALGLNGSNGNGGGIYVKGGVATVSGGTIKYNRGLGGGVAVNGGTLNLTGGAITDNASPTPGSIGGIHLYNNGTLNMSGNPVVKDNIRNATITEDGIQPSSNSIYCNVYLYPGKVINVTGTITSGADIGMWLQPETAGTVLTSGYKANKGSASHPAQYFSMDSGVFAIGENADGEVELVSAVAVVSQGMTTIGYSTLPLALETYNSYTDDSDTQIKLLADITTTSASAFTASGVLDLNGYKLVTTGNNSVITVDSGVTLTIKDSRPNAQNTYTVAGTTTTATVAGGIISGGTATNGGGIYVNSNATLNILGGNIVGNKASSSGSAIYYAGGSGSGSLSISGGSVSGNAITTDKGYGAIAITNGGAFTMTGGTISNNDGREAGGAIDARGGANVQISGGTIYGNKANWGGAIHQDDDATAVTITGSAIIENNTAYNSGGAVRVNKGALTLSGNAIVRNNTVSGNAAISGGGISSNTGSINIEGGITVVGNTKNSIANNIYLDGNQKINVSGALEDSAEVGVSLATYPQAGTEVVITQGYADTNTSQPDVYFTIDSSNGYSVMLSADNEVIIAGSVATITSGGVVKYFATFASAVTQFNTLSDDDGKVLQLVADNSVSTAVEISSSGTLDLNGYKLIKSGNQTISAFTLTGGQLTITDSRANVANTYTANSNQLSAVGGVITGFNASGIKLTGGTLNMQAGTVAGNSSTGEGGGIYVGQNATLNILGSAAVVNNSAENGGGIYAAGTVVADGNANISLNYASGTGTNGGGGICVDGGNVTLKGNTKVTLNFGIGAGIYLKNGTLDLQGAVSITDNATSTNSQIGGIHFAAGTLKMSGSLNITGNISGTIDKANSTISPASGATERNVYLVDGNTITVSGSLAGSTIGVEKQTLTGVYTTGYSADNLSLDPADVFVFNAASSVTKSDYALDLNDSNEVEVFEAKIKVDDFGFIKLNKAVNKANELGTATTPTITLLADISSDSMAELTQSAVLNLNDKVITYTASTGSVIKITNNATLTLKDEATSKTQKSGIIDGVAIEGGVITGGVGSEGTISGKLYGGAIMINGGSLIMDGGTLAGNAASNGGGVYVRSGSFTLNGGNIVANTSTDAGAAVNIENGTFTMSGGTITGNSAMLCGGAVYVSGGTTFNMTEGTIANNTTSGNGAGVYFAGGTFNMSAGTISGNTAPSTSSTAGQGGGIYVGSSSAQVNISGTAQITSNRAKRGGGAIYIANGAVTLSGSAQITSNTSSATSVSGVHVGGGTFTVSGSVVIKGNVRDSGVPSNVYLASGRKITIGGDLDSTASIGVHGLNFNEGFIVTSGFTTNNTTASEADNFVIDDPTVDATKVLVIENDEVVLRNVVATIAYTDTSSNERITKKYATINLIDFNNTDGKSDIVMTLYKDVELTETFPYTGVGKLDLNGHTVSYTGTEEKPVLSITGTLEITDSLTGGTITGGKDSGIIVTDSGNVTLSGNVQVCGNSTQIGEHGGGVTVESGATLTVKDNASIHDNTAVNGGGINKADGATVNINGGSIVNNSATTAGGGVYVPENNQVNIGGPAQITGNTCGTDDKVTNNVSLEAGATINVTGSLEGDGSPHANIGVTSKDTTDDYAFAVNYTKTNPDYEPGRYFFDDVNGKVPVIDDGGNIKLGEHVHVWSYEVVDNTIVAKCVSEDTQTTCELDNHLAGSVSISGVNGTYDGINQHEVIFTNNMLTAAYNAGNPTLAYTKGETSVTSTKDAGSYTATLTLNKDCSITTTFEVAKAQLTVTPNDASLKYGQSTDVLYQDDENLNGVSFSGFVGSDSQESANITGEVVYTYSYNQYGAVGTYIITIDVTGLVSDNYTFVVATDEQDAQIKGTLTVEKALLSAISFVVADKIYDKTTTAEVTDVKFDGLLNNDQILTETTATFAQSNVGQNISVSLNYLTISGSGADNYDLDSSWSTLTSTGNIVARKVTFAGIVAADKDHDGNTDVVIDISAVTFNNVIEGDSLTLVLKSGEVGAQFASADAGIDKQVNINVSSFELGGSDAGNYEIAAEGNQTTAIASIIGQAVTISGIKVVTKQYDGTTTAQLDFSEVQFALGDSVVSITVDPNDITADGAFVDKSVGEGKIVKISNIKVNASLGDYVLATEGNQTEAYGTITQKNVTVADVDAYEKVYDGTKDATLILDKNVITLNGLVNGDDVTVDAVGQFVSADAGKNKDISITYIGISGADAGNYTLDSNNSQQVANADISKRTITVSGLLGIDKVYNGNTTATLDTTAAVYDGLIAGDYVVLDASGVFESQNVGDYMQVAINSSSLKLIDSEGSSFNNYVLATEGNQTETTASITKMVITVTSGITAKDKEYNGQLDIELDVSGAVFQGVVLADVGTVKLVSAEGTLTDKNVGNDKIVVIDGTSFVLDEQSQLKYELATDGNQSTTTAKVTQKSVTVSGIKAYDKSYNGTQVVILDTTDVVFDGLVEGDLLTISSSASGQFEDKNAGVEKIVNISGLALSGESSGNYKINTDDSQKYTTATIEKVAVSRPTDLPASIVYGDDISSAYGSGVSTASLSEQEEALTVGTHTIGVILADTQNTYWADTDNQTTYYYDITVVTRQVAIPSADNTVYVYNGQAQTYNIQISQWYTISGATQTEANTYTVTVSLVDTANTVWSDNTIEDKLYTFTINSSSLNGGEKGDDSIMPLILILCGVAVALAIVVFVVMMLIKKHRNSASAFGFIPLLATIFGMQVDEWEKVVAVLLIIIIVVLVISAIACMYVLYKTRKNGGKKRTESDGLLYQLTQDGKGYDVAGIGTCEDSKIVIASKVDGLLVRGIRPGAFENCQQLVSVYVPTTIQDIGVGAFKDCDNLSYVKFGEISGWYIEDETNGNTPVTKVVKWPSKTAFFLKEKWANVHLKND